MNTTYLSAHAFATLYECAVVARWEIVFFLAAILAYFALFGNAMPTSKNKIGVKFKRLREDINDHPSRPVSEDDYAKIEILLQKAFEQGDYRSVLVHWNSLKQSWRLANVNFAHVVESMQRLRKDSNFIAKEMRTVFTKYSQLKVGCMNDLLDSLSKRVDSDLMDVLVMLLRSSRLEHDGRTYEILMSMYFNLRRFQDVREIVKEVQAKRLSLTARAIVIVIKTALKLNDLEEAQRWFCELSSKGSVDSPSMALMHCVSQLVDLACKEHQLDELLPLLREAPLNEEILVTMLLECACQKDANLALRVERLAVAKNVTFSERLYAPLVKALSEQLKEGSRVVDLAMQHEGVISADLAFAILAFCSQHKDLQRANMLREKLGALQPSLVSAFIRFYIGCDEHREACDLYELMAKERSGLGASCVDTRLERMLMIAALKSGRSELASSLLAATPSDVVKHLTMIRNCAAEGNLNAAINVFKALQHNGVEVNSTMYNMIIDACVECKDLKAAESWMKQTRDAGFSDVVSYNTLIKAHLATDNFTRARSLMVEMREAGHSPNQVTFNELLNAVVSKRHRSKPPQTEVWALVAEMRKMGITPNHVTCSILMKSLNKDSPESDLVKVMDLISLTEEPMDEVLLSSVVEACVRLGNPDLVATKLKQLKVDDTSIVNGAHTFGSIIKAYGFAGDIDSAWRCWRQMRSRHIRPTSVTIGCMVEAIVNNGDTEGACELIHEIAEADGGPEVLNSIIYCSVLKGFAREKKFDRAFSVYEEMIERHIDLSIVTFNTLVDVCARCGRMDRVAGLLERMKLSNIRPNVITYSTILKGHCQAGDVHTAFAVVKAMKEESGFRPDEIMYNSLLDGCAQKNLVDEGLKVLAEMEASGIQPSNFTLSVLIKLMSRARRLDAAFELVEALVGKYQLKLNVHVYTNLAQACIHNRALGNAMHLFEKMLSDKIPPESRTYAILIRANIQQGLRGQAGELLRAALGLPGVCGYLAQKVALCPKLDSALIKETLISLAEDSELAFSLVADIKQYCPKVRIDFATHQRLMQTEKGLLPQPPQRTAQCRPQQHHQWQQGSNRRRAAACEA